MIDLDDRAALRDGDPGGMLDAVLALPERCRDGYALGAGTAGLPSADGLASISFCGMGGSAFAGDVIRSLAAGSLPLPVTVVRSAELPAHCGRHTLVIVSSQSGETAETLSLLDAAVERGCRVIAVTSGGRLAARADELGLACVLLPETPMPRAAVGYLTLGSLGALEAMGLFHGIGADLAEAVNELEQVRAACEPSVPTRTNPAKSLALRIGERVPVIWGAEGFAAVAAGRWRTQCHENAKVPAFSAALPELDHNEVVGWSRGRGDRFFLVALRHDGEHPDVAVRFPPSIEMARSSGMEAEEVWAGGRSPLAGLLSLVLRGDLVSTYLGLGRGVDPTPIEAIVRLKHELAGT